jgi:antirestriction protein ArdC
MNIHEEITNEIIAAIEAGAGAFRMPWHRLGATPKNASTQAVYRGINLLNLEVSRSKQRLASPYWASFKQWQELGAKVKKGEKGTLIVFYKPLLVEDSETIPADTESESAENGQKRIFFLRHSYVFNADQVEGWTAPEVLPDLTERLSGADAFIRSTGAEIREGGSRAFYNPEDDFIGMPSRSLFIESSTQRATEGYYGTLLHELVHWTGSAARCNRNLKGCFWSGSYAEEELVAELGAAFLCSQLGVSVSVRSDHAQYLEQWLKVLKSDAKAIFRASAQASRAVAYLEGLQPLMVRSANQNQAFGIPHQQEEGRENDF